MSNTIIIKTQHELDSLPLSFKEFTYIEIKNSERIVVSKTWDNSSVIARGNSSVEAYGNSSVIAMENSSVIARNNSSVIARGNSSVIAMENSSVEAYGNSSVIAMENSSVIARNNSSVIAYGNSSVIAMENSSVIAMENSSVEAYGNSSVRAYESSSVSAFDFAMISVLVATVVIKKLKNWAIVSLRGFDLGIKYKDKTATVVKTPVEIEHTRQDFFNRCESKDKDTVILYKSVNPETLCDFNTGKIKYKGTVKCPDWNPDNNIKCGGGLHLCATKGEALSYNQGKILKCEVKKKDIVVYTKNLSKVRCRKVKVLKEGK